MGHGRGEPSALRKDLRHAYPRYGNTLLSTCSRRKTRYSMSLASVMTKEGRMPPPRASPDTSFAKQRQVPADRQALPTAPSARACQAVRPGGATPPCQFWLKSDCHLKIFIQVTLCVAKLWALVSFGGLIEQTVW